MIYTEKTENEILSDNPDFVLDAIDNLDTKVAIFIYSFKIKCNLGCIVTCM